MYFGLAGISSYPFVPLGAGLVLLWSLLLGLVYYVGAARGAPSALRYFRVVLWGGFAALAATWVWALLTGQWGRFIAEFGWQPMAEMLVLAALLVFTMAWMGMTYVSGKLRKEPDGPEADDSRGLREKRGTRA